jgi:hypothetical protein
VEIRIARRYRGPLDSANGGYACGLVAAAVGGSAEVTLRLPPPLERPLAVVPAGDGVEVWDADRLVAEGRPATPALEVPAAPSFAEAATLAPAAAGWGLAVFAECYVCGTRPDGSGLEIHARPVPGRDLVAAAWTARDVSEPVVWAVIDCPGAYALGEPGRGEPVLGRMTAAVARLPLEGERCVVIGWPLGADGRKLYAGTALVGADGAVLACARQVWIAPRPAG